MAGQRGLQEGIGERSGDQGAANAPSCGPGGLRPGASRALAISAQQTAEGYRRVPSSNGTRTAGSSLPAGRIRGSLTGCCSGSSLVMGWPCVKS